MKRWLKITLISLGALIALVGIVVAVACWLLLTPAKLTGIVNNLAAKYVLCETHFNKVDLTLFSTFPEAGLEVHNVVVVNPQPFAPSDTVACIERLTVAINVSDFLRRGDINVRQLLLDNATASVAIDANGASNIDIFPSSNDTSSSATVIPNLALRKVAIRHLNATYHDAAHHTDGSLADLSLVMKGEWHDDEGNVKLKVDGQSLCLAMADSMGRPSMKAFVEGLQLNAKGQCLQSTLRDTQLKIAGDSIALVMTDTAGHSTIDADLCKMALKVVGEGSTSAANGTLTLTLPKAAIATAGTQWTTHNSLNRGQLLKVELPFRADLNQRRFTLADASLTLAKHAMTVDGTVALADSSAQGMDLDLTLATEQWDVAPLLMLLPKHLTAWQKGMALDAKMRLTAHAHGRMVADTLPLIDAEVWLADGQFQYPQALPYNLDHINAHLTANIDLNGKSHATVHQLSARSGKNSLALSGSVDDVLGAIAADLSVKGDVCLADLQPLMPDSLPLQANGMACLDLRAKGSLEQVVALDLAKMKASGTIKVKNLDATYNDIHALSPDLTVALQLPASRRNAKVGELIEARLTGETLKVEMPSSNLAAQLHHADLQVGLNNIMDSTTQLAASCNISMSAMGAQIDSLSLSTAHLSMKGNISMDSTQQNLLLQLNPDMDIDLRNAKLSMPQLAESLAMPNFRFNYVPGHCRISQADIVVGRSDYHLSGTVLGLEDWIEHKQMLTGDLSFTSSFTDLDQLLDLVSGLGSDADTLQQQRQEDHVAAEANPFIVPRDVDFVLHTHINRTLAFGNDLSDVEGGVYIKDGVAILDQVGFACKAAKMQLTAMYKSPRPNHLFLGMDFHLLDIYVDELIDMIPYIDTVVPMLSAFSGNADFHITAETYLNAFYQPKVSTLRGAAAITGKDLVVLDSETFRTISNLMLFSRKTENRIDSLDVELTLFRNEVELYPFLISMDKYQAIVAGRHTLANAYDYHLEVIRCPLPGRVAIDVNGVLPKLNFKVGKVQYGELYRPERRNAAQNYTMELKTMILRELESNVKEKTKQLKR